MVRFAATVDGLRQLTPEEEAELDALQAARAAGENDRLAPDARKKRNELLSESDWMVTKSFELNAPLDAAWAAYRQALRDLPAQSGFPTSIDWPIAPGGA